ncbi:MAG: DsbA family oxidoreductase [Halocynthiibacter sp.]
MDKTPTETTDAPFEAPLVKLDILSDPICPWCYIGKTWLDRALEAHPEHPFVIEWHPFQLNDNMPTFGMERRQYLETKFGGQENAMKVYSEIDKTAREAGLEMAWEKIDRTPNTLNAHRLIHWAGLEGKQTAVVSALFKAYFQLGVDIGDTDALSEIAGKCGMDQAAVKRLFDTDGDLQLVKEQDAQAREMGVRSVPTFVLANEHVLAGAQRSDIWSEIIADVNRQLAAAPKPPVS